MTQAIVRPHPFVLVAANDSPMIVSRLDYAKSPQGFYGVGHQLLTTGVFDPSEIELVLALLDERRARAGSVMALDCGANVGVHTLAMAKHMTGWGTVQAFEAQERLFYALAGNIALNNVFNAQASLAAVGRASGSMQVPCPDYTRSGSLGSLELQQTARTEFIGQSVSYAEADTVAITVLSIDSLALARLDFVKIDVEGMELDVLEGARTTLEQCRPTLLIEWIKSGRAEIKDFLAPLGYELKEVGMNVLARAQ